MTLLDAAVIVFLLLISAGGYRQGLLRGVIRAGALIAIGMLAALLSIGGSITGSPQAVITRALALFAGVALFVGAIAWLINRAVPRIFHRSRINRALGVVPALVQGLIVVALVLGFVHRVALEQTTQEYIARGVVTGPLIQPFNWIERTLAGAR